MMRTSFQPLAHLVDAAAEKWLAAENASRNDRLAIAREITRSFRIGDQAEMTFHGMKFQLVIARRTSANNKSSRHFRISVHEISQES